MSQRLDFTRLLGFETLVEANSGSVDFRAEEVSARLGAKAGEPTKESWILESCWVSRR